MKISTYDSIIDTGATYTQIPTQYKLYPYILHPSQLYVGIDEYCRKNASGCKGKKSGANDLCYTIDQSVKSREEFFNSFPTIYIRINNEDIPWTPDRYFVPVKGNAFKYCMGIESEV